MNRRVLITDGEQRAALAVARSLGGAGHRVHVVSSRSRSLAGASRFAAGQQRVADPLRAPERFVDDVRAAVARWGIDLLLPVAEPSILALLTARESFAGVCLPMPELEVFRRVTDKAALLEAAHDVGIAVPPQWTVPTPDALRALELADDLFPLVIKPARSVGTGAAGRVKLEVAHAADRARLLREVAKLPDAAYPLLLQQRVVGPGIGIFLLLWEGRVLASFAHRRLREKPPSGGVSVYRESIPVDPALLALARALLDRFDWCGAAMVEFKVDAATGRPFLMEVNGRFWGSLQLAVDAGVDFPALLVQAASGPPPAPVTEYRTGVRSRWWWGDVDHLLARLRRSPAQLDLPASAPGRWRSILDFLTLWRPGDCNEIFRLDDPWPLVRESIDWLTVR